MPEITWIRPEGGLCVWMSLPARIETGFDSPLFKQATKVDGVMYVPGELSYGGPPTTANATKCGLASASNRLTASKWACAGWLRPFGLCCKRPSDRIRTLIVGRFPRKGSIFGIPGKRLGC